MDEPDNPPEGQSLDTEYISAEPDLDLSCETYIDEYSMANDDEKSSTVNEEESAVTPVKREQFIINQDEPEASGLAEQSVKKPPKPRPHVCETCGKGFSHKPHLKRHVMMMHEGIKPHVCKTCGKGFTHRAGLTNHSFMHEGFVQICDICDEGFTQMSEWKKHALVHGLKSYVCEICDKLFTQNSHLKRHSLTHVGARPFVCKTCGRTFTQKSALKTHGYMHEGVKPYQCTKCEKGFTQKSELEKHHLIHDGIRPHVCDVCNKSFTQKSQLSTHVLIHKGIKHGCAFCHKSFTRKSALRNHTYLHIGERPHVCNVCNKGFTQRYLLKKHLLVHEDSEISNSNTDVDSSVQVSDSESISMVNQGLIPNLFNNWAMNFTQQTELVNHKSAQERLEESMDESEDFSTQLGNHLSSVEVNLDIDDSHEHDPDADSSDSPVKYDSIDKNLFERVDIDKSHEKYVSVKSEPIDRSFEEDEVSRSPEGSKSYEPDLFEFVEINEENMDNLENHLD